MLTAIRSNDPKLKKDDKPLFKDEDFEEGAKSNVGKQKKMTLKDQIREHTLKKMKKDESSDEESSDGESDAD